MAYVYLIINNINNKPYVGATVNTISERFSKHVWESFNLKDNSALHRAIKKYGIENFNISKLEECSVQEVFNREKYWIKYYNSYENGYNETPGGEGHPKFDYELIYQKFNSGMLQKDIAKELGCEKHTITRALRAYDVSDNEMKKGKFGNSKKKVYQIDLKTNKILKEFESLTEVAKYEHLSVSKISLICSGKQKLVNKDYTYKKEK